MYIKFQCWGSGALNLRFETCQEGKIRHVCSYLRHKHKLLKLSGVSNFMTCSKCLILRGSYLSFRTLYEDKIFKYFHQTLIDTKCEQSYA